MRRANKLGDSALKWNTAVALHVQCRWPGYLDLAITDMIYLLISDIIFANARDLAIQTRKSLIWSIFNFWIQFFTILVTLLFGPGNAIDNILGLQYLTILVTLVYIVILWYCVKKSWSLKRFSSSHLIDFQELLYWRHVILVLSKCRVLIFDKFYFGKFYWNIAKIKPTFLRTVSNQPKKRGKSSAKMKYGAHFLNQWIT